MKKVYEVYAEGYLDTHYNWNGNGTFVSTDFRKATERMLELASYATDYHENEASDIVMDMYEVDDDWIYDDELPSGKTIMRFTINGGNE